MVNVDMLLLLLSYLGYLAAMEIVPERHEIEYLNGKYLNHMKVLFRKTSRNSPHLVTMEIGAKVAVGNNLTIKMELFEFLGGHFIPTFIRFDYKLCDFFQKERFMGQMYAKQLPANFTCPFPAGEYIFNDIVIHLENFPYIPFTYDSVIVRTRVDVQGVHTETNEEIFRWKTFVRITQKIQKEKTKKKMLMIKYDLM